MEWITGGLTNLWTVFDGAISHLTNDTFFAILLVSSLVVVAFKLIKKAKKAARN